MYEEPTPDTKLLPRNSWSEEYPIPPTGRSLSLPARLPLRMMSGVGIWSRYRFFGVFFGIFKKSVQYWVSIFQKLRYRYRHSVFFYVCIII